MVVLIIWSIVCFYTIIWTFVFLKDLARGKFNIISMAYKSGRIVTEIVIIMIFYAILITTFMNIVGKLHLLWLVPVGILTGMVLGCCIIRIMVNINSCKEPQKVEEN